MISSTKVLLTGLLVLVMAAFCLSADKLAPGREYSGTGSGVITWSTTVMPFTLRSVRFTADAAYSNTLSLIYRRGTDEYTFLTVAPTGVWKTVTLVIPGDMSISPNKNDSLVLSLSTNVPWTLIMDTRYDDMQ